MGGDGYDPGLGSMESQPRDHQGSLSLYSLQDENGLVVVQALPPHLPLPLAHLSHGPPTEPAVEMSEEHLEEKCSVCG